MGSDMDETAPHRHSHDPDLRDPYGKLAELETVLDAVNSPASYYEQLFTWRTDLDPKLYLLQFVAPMIDGRFLAYPLEDTASKEGIIFDKTSLYAYILESKKEENEGNGPILPIIGWSIFFFMITIYFFLLKYHYLFWAITFFLQYLAIQYTR